MFVFANLKWLQTIRHSIANRSVGIARLKHAILLVLVFLLSDMLAEFSFSQTLFRAPTIPNVRTIGDHARGVSQNTRFGLSPHLTAAQSIDIGVPQSGRPIDFVSPADPNQSTGVDSTLGLEAIEGIEVPSENETPQIRETSDQDERYRAQRPVSGREIIVQRYPDGKPQIEREVIQDADGNFVNDGFWRVLSRKGEKNEIASGEYRRGVMQGVWQRQHTKESSGLFSTKPFSLFESPFLSMATFNEGELDGMWTLADAYERKIFEIGYRKGKRHGTATWWFPSMTKMREVTFKNGTMDGHLREWDEQNKLIRDEEFVNGQKIIRNVTFYRPKQKESENFYLDAKLTVDGQDNWWDARPAPMVADGQKLQHGPAVAWYDNGLPKMKGQYAEGVRVGRFTWWHSNGNKQLEGNYQRDEKIGVWTWWHENGMKSIEGQYENNQATGNWRWWEESGKLDSEEDLSRLESPNRDNVGAKSGDSIELDSLNDPVDMQVPSISGPEELPEALPEPANPQESGEADRAPLLDLNDLEGIDPLKTEGADSSGAGRPELNKLSQPESGNADELPENFFVDG